MPIWVISTYNKLLNFFWGTKTKPGKSATLGSREVGKQIADGGVRGMECRDLTAHYTVGQERKEGSAVLHPTMSPLLIIIILLLLIGGGGFYLGGPAIGGGGIGLILLIVLIVYLAGGLRGK